MTTTFDLPGFTGLTYVVTWGSDKLLVTAKRTDGSNGDDLIAVNWQTGVVSDLTVNSPEDEGDPAPIDDDRFFFVRTESINGVRLYRVLRQRSVRHGSQIDEVTMPVATKQDLGLAYTPNG